MQPSAKIILDSINEQGHRLTTMEVVMHRFVLAEFNTHRVFSRNSASSRAIPFSKTRQRVQDDIAFPVHWGAEQKGMQSGAVVDDPEMCKVGWETARDKAIQCAQALHEGYDVHKSLVNRLLEPFMWHTVIVTATEWDNFFWQRCHPDAQPEMKAAADAMQLAYYESTPKPMAPCDWHMPYIRDEDSNDVIALIETAPGDASPYTISRYLQRISVARCARVSYLTHDGVRKIEADLELYDRLVGSGHWSPFEHVATPSRDSTPEMWGNFVGWRQYRKQFQNENRKRFIPNLPELAQVAMKMEAGL